MAKQVKTNEARMSEPRLEFQKLSPAQTRALGRLGKMKSAPKKFIVGFQVNDDSYIVVVGNDPYDNRRWDITKGGKITRRVR